MLKPYYENDHGKLYCGDCLEILRQLPDQSVNCCVTSPPYWGLRDYGVDGQIGLEETPEAYVARMVEVFREVRRVLRDDGTLWLNLGDSYAGSGKGAWSNKDAQKEVYVPDIGDPVTRTRTVDGHRAKQLIGIPWRVAFALQADGWYLRQDIIWAKPNPMPESVRDRCTKAHEYIFLMSKRERYYYDAEAIKEPCVQDEMANGFRGGAYCNNSIFDNQAGGSRKNVGNYKVPTGWDTADGSHGTIHRQGRKRRDTFGRDGPVSDHIIPGQTYAQHRQRPIVNEESRKELRSDIESRHRSSIPGGQSLCAIPAATRNKRDVWTVATHPFSEAHFATFPPALIEPCILAGCPKGGVVLDPFFGSGTTGEVCQKNYRNWIGIELSQQYCDLSVRRVNGETGQIEGQVTLFDKV